MKPRLLLGGTTLLLLLLLVQSVSSLMKNQTRDVPFQVRGEETAAVELVVEDEEQGIYFFPRGKTMAACLSGINPQWEGGETTAVTPGMSVRIRGNRLRDVTDMSPHKAMALGIPSDINRMSREEMMLVPGIGEKTSTSIVAYIQSRGCIRDLSELSAIRGIKERKIARMRPYLTTRPETCGGALTEAIP
ncbi:MAG: helix-hairpin-helix domain-containing protein [Deltaproteobacteria bacterium]|jgi:competence protein ComEA|nr:helix-hairpin-helix domain-containing protein [Deltaproteobacteria bacterium]